MSQNTAETTCASCGRFIASWERCPFCRHFNPKRPIIRLLKYSTPILTILGILLLGHMGRTQGITEVKIAALGRKTNFAQVQIKGRVNEEVRFHAADPESLMGSSSLEFEVDDGTGLIRVRCYEEPYENLLAAGKIPGFNDRVAVVGNYQFKAKRQFMILGSPDDVQIERQQPATYTPINQLNDIRISEFRRVKVAGRITSAIESAFEIQVWLEDPQGRKAPVSLSPSLLQAYGLDPDKYIADMLAKDNYITCVGTLDWSKSRKGPSWVLVPAAPADITVADEQTWNKENGGTQPN